MTLIEMMNTYIQSNDGIKQSDTIRGEHGHIRAITKCLEHLNIVTIEDLKYESYNQIVKYYKTHTNNKNASINKYVSYLKAVLRYYGFHDHQFLLVKKLKDDTSHVKPIYDDDLIDIFRYVKALNKNDNSITYRAVIELLYSTGCRIGELLDIKIRNVDIKHKMILLEQTKTRKERFVFFSKTQIDMIKELIDKQPKREYLFWNFLKKRRLNKNDVKLFNRNMKENLGLRVFYSRQMRKTMATDLAKFTKGDLKMIQTILGHSDIKMTQVYVEYSTDQAKDAYMSVEEKLFYKITNDSDG